MPVFLKLLFTRTIIFYLACLILIGCFMNYHQLIENAIPQTMSRLTPPMDYFSEFVDKQGDYDRYKLMNCVNYHRAVADFFAFQRAEAYGMLGFCYERLGQGSQAVSSFRQAIMLNPDYFWPYYDLGIIYYQKAQYAQAVDYFKQAIEQAPLKSLLLLSRSKVYNDVRLSQAKGSYDYIEGLKEGHIKAYTLLMDSLLKTGSYEELWKTALFALREDPNNADAMMYLGMCLHAANKEEMAQVMMRKAALLHGQEGTVIAPDLKARVRFF